MKAEDELVPRALCGGYGPVRREWRRIARAAIKAGSWHAVLGPDDFIPLKEAPGLLLRKDDHMLTELWAKGEHVLLMPGYEVLGEVAFKLSKGDREKWYRDVRDRVLEATEQFWGVLCLFSQGPQFISTETYEAERSWINAELLSRVLRDWDKLRELDSRFSNFGIPIFDPDHPAPVSERGWRLYAHIIAATCREVGIPESELYRACDVPMAEARETVAAWIRPHLERGRPQGERDR